MTQKGPETRIAPRRRTSSALFFLDVKDVTHIPHLAEPFFLGLNARITFCPAMNPQDLKTGLEKLKL